ncbi:MAG: choice-of-anchor A family protein [bacterium]
MKKKIPSGKFIITIIILMFVIVIFLASLSIYFISNSRQSIKYSDTDGWESTGVVLGTEDVNFSCPYSPLGAASNFNIYTLENLTLSNVDLEGRVAVGGNATFKNFAIGGKLTNSNGTRDDLIVNNNLEYTDGTVLNGNIIYGGSGNILRVAVPNGNIIFDKNFDFVSANNSIKSKSIDWSNLIPNGTVTSTPGNITITGLDPTLNIINIPNGIVFANTLLTINAPTGSTILINVFGNDINLSNMAMYFNGATADKVLFNFFQATTMDIQAVGIQGSVLAPLANVTYNNGQNNGTLIAKSILGVGEAHNYIFKGCITLPSNTPTITSTTSIISNTPIQTTTITTSSTSTTIPTSTILPTESPTNSITPTQTPIIVNTEKTTIQPTVSISYFVMPSIKALKLPMTAKSTVNNLKSYFLTNTGDGYIPFISVLIGFLIILLVIFLIITKKMRSE